jgi:F0F1-type ATP synthase membrane subunit c/vacuolar-type H+-ATPase subunit K
VFLKEPYKLLSLLCSAFPTSVALYNTIKNKDFVDSLAATIHYLLVALIVILPAVSVAYGQAKAGKSVINAIDMQPGGSAASLYCFLFGTALSETAAIFTTIIGFMLLTSQPPSSFAYSLVELGIFCSLALPAVLVGFLSSYSQYEAMLSVAKQPFNADKITNFMVIALSMMQLSVLLGLIISIVMYAKLHALISINEAFSLFAAGCTFGAGTIGPLLGMARFSATACRTVGAYPQSYGALLSSAFVNQALIETPILFSLSVALFIMFYPAAQMSAVGAASLAMALCTLGPGIASGRIASAACEAIGMHPEKLSLFSYTSMMAQTLVDASVIYGVIIAALLLFFAT